MNIIPWPTSIKTGPVDYGVEFDVQMTIYRNGRVDTFGLPGARWVCSVRMETDLEQRLIRPKLEALIMSLEGGANRLSFHHFGRPVPNGTLKGSPTVASTVAQGARSMTIANANGGLKAGDLIGVQGQIVMILADADPTLTNLTVSFAPAMRNQVNSGTAVVWNKPTTTWIPKSNVAGPFPYEQGRVRPGISFEFVEAW